MNAADAPQLSSEDMHMGKRDWTHFIVQYYQPHLALQRYMDEIYPRSRQLGNAVHAAAGAAWFISVITQRQVRVNDLSLVLMAVAEVSCPLALETTP